MANAQGAQNDAPKLYALPEYAYAELIQLREHLRLMAQLTNPGAAPSALDAALRPEAFAWWFSRLSRDIAWVVQALHGTDSVAEAPLPTIVRKRKGRKSEQRRHA